jgi:putative phosphoribosyl transferase
MTATTASSSPQPDPDAEGATAEGPVRFRDRRQAGRALGERVRQLDIEDPVVLGLPRGGVPVAYEVAQALEAPLDVIVARKVGAPGNPELGIGAVAEGDVRVFDRRALRLMLISAEELAHSADRVAEEVDRRVRLYRSERVPVPLGGRTAIVVDDGIATGGTARAALKAVRARGARRVVLAVPVGPPQTLAELAEEADEVVWLTAPATMLAIGFWYDDFAQTSDAEVGRLLATDGTPGEPPADWATAIDVAIQAGEREALPGDLTIPDAATSLVLFAHGSGSSRRSPRNRQVAAALRAAHHATLLFDLLMPDEEAHRSKVFDIALLSRRLVAATSWALERPELADLPIGYFGASTGAAAALLAAAERRASVRAVVSRGGRPDLAGPRLGDVAAPTLLIVGGDDRVTLELNREAMHLMRCPVEFAIVPGATHLFEEPGALEQVATLAADWFSRHLRS